MPETHQKGLIHIAREMHKTTDAMRASYASTGRSEGPFLPLQENHGEQLAKLVTLRTQLLESKPESPLDCLMILGALRAIASYIFEGISHLEDRDQEPLAQIHGGMAEMLTGLFQLQGVLERDCGHTLASLNLFSDGNAIQ